MKYLFLAAALLGTNALTAQAIPLFETTIYVHDTLGNRDSVRLGYDLDAVLNDTTLFHDTFANGLYDTVLDMRAAVAVLGAWHPNGGDNLFKRLVVPAETTSDGVCTLGAGVILWIYAKHKPITLTWDREIFAGDICRENAFFSPNKRYLIANPIPIIEAGGTVYACASESDSLVWGLRREFMVFDQGVLTYTAEREFKGGYTDTIVGIYFDYPAGSYFSPCRIPTSSTDPGVDNFYPDASMAVWPNPGNGLLNMENHRWQEVVAVQLSDLAGRLIWENHALVTGSGMGSYPIEDLPPCLYVITSFWADGYTASRKWVVGAAR